MSIKFSLLLVMFVFLMIAKEMGQSEVQTNEKQAQVQEEEGAVEDGIPTMAYVEEFALFEGKWNIIEYADYAVDSHCDEIYTEEYQRQVEEHIDTVIQKYAGRILTIDGENVTSFSPASDSNFHLESWQDLFHVVRQPPTLAGVSKYENEDNQRHPNPFSSIQPDGSFLP